MESKIAQEIIDHSITQFMSYGFKSVSMDDLSTQMGISKKTIYKYFDGKEELISSCLKDYLRQEEQLLQHLEQSSVDAVEDMIRTSEHFMNTFREMRSGNLYELQKYYKSVWLQIVDWESQFIKQRMSNNLKRGISEGLYRDNIDPEIISDLYVQNIYNIVSNTKKYEKLGLDRTLRQHILYHLHGILSVSGIAQVEKLNLIKQ